LQLKKLHYQTQKLVCLDSKIPTISSKDGYINSIVMQI
jgi:hypothetical protein